LEFPDADVIPIGHNLTILCMGTKSGESGTKLFSKQPQLFFRGVKVKECGGSYSDREDKKSCKLDIENASSKISGQYGCIVTNLITCSSAELTLNLTGEISLYVQLE